MGMQELADIIGKAVYEARNGGKAIAGTVNGDMVSANGKTYKYKLIVPITIQDGQSVVVQIDAFDDTAYIIG